MWWKKPEPDQYKIDDGAAVVNETGSSFLHSSLSVVRDHPLISFFLLTFVFSWGVRVPSIFLSGWPAPISFLAMFGPAFAAVVVSLITGEQQQTARMFRSLLQWKVSPVWYPIAIFLPVGLIMLPVLITPAEVNLGASVTPIISLVLVNFAYLILLVWGEEIGWRGFALPRLQARFHPIVASTLLGLIWGIWHLPNFWISGSLQAFVPIPIYLLYILGHTFLYSWIYNGARGSLFLVCIHHAATNALTVAILAHPISAVLANHPAALLAGVLIMDAVVLLLTKGRLLVNHVQDN